MNKIFRVAIFASGNGTNAEAILNYFKSHDSIEISLIASNNKNAFVLKRALAHHVFSFVFNKDEFRNLDFILAKLREKQITHLVLAGFMWLVPSYLVAAYPNKIINIHPALLPAYGGKGMFGMYVHQAVKANNESQTGITIHLVNEKYDEGKILLQKICNIDVTDTPEDIATKVHHLEHEFYPKQIEKWIMSL
jgi:phosphoribosylglycinamide formyltransferase-1